MSQMPMVGPHPDSMDHNSHTMKMVGQRDNDNDANSEPDNDYDDKQG